MIFTKEFQVSLWRKITDKKWNLITPILTELLEHCKPVNITNITKPYNVYTILFKAGSSYYKYYFVFKEDVLVDGCTDTEEETNRYLERNGYRTSLENT